MSSLRIRSHQRSARRLLVVLLAGALVSAQAAGDDAAARASLERVVALRAQRPLDGLLAYYQALAHVALGEREAALRELRSLLGRRLGLIPPRGVGFDALWDDAEFQALRTQLAAEEPRTPDAPVSFRLADPKLIPEGIAFDPKRRRYFVGSVAQKKIVVTDGHGRVRDFSAPGDRLDAVLGLAVDARRDVLYAISTNGIDDGARTDRRNALVRYDLKQGRLAARHEAPGAAQLNDVAIAADGTLYVTDSGAGSVFRLKPGETVLTPFGKPGSARGANGIAVAPDGTLYVTLSTGIARIEPSDGALQRLDQPDDVVTGGIDGLYWHDGALVGIQNTTSPGRVIRIELGPGGRRITGLRVLQSHHHAAFDEPTTGAIANGRLHVLANTYVGRLQPDGTLQAAALLPTVVIGVPLRL